MLLRDYAIGDFAQVSLHLSLVGFSFFLLSKKAYLVCEMGSLSDVNGSNISWMYTLYHHNEHDMNTTIIYVIESLTCCKMHSSSFSLLSFLLLIG